VSNLREMKGKTMFNRTTIYALSAGLGLAVAANSIGCEQSKDATESERIGTSEDAITDVAHTPVERQSIGNCWLYAEATWVESMNLSFIQANAGGGGGNENTCVHTECTEGDLLDASCSSCASTICEADPYCCDNSWDHLCTGAVANLCPTDACTGGGGEPPTAAEELDVSQSYWTYWHWFDQVTGYMYKDEISTGGNEWKSHGIIRDRGLMNEIDFVPEDSNSEMSNRQSSALNKINNELKEGGRLATQNQRRDGKNVRQVFDEAWGLSPEVTAQLNSAFGEDGEGTLRQGGSVEGTKIIDGKTLPVRFTKWEDGQAVVKDTTLVEAVSSWNTVRYPNSASARREFLQRVQRALHDRQPVVITWDVEFNAMENGDNDRRGSFNLQTLEEAGGPGSQGGHMTVLEDYAAETEAFGFLEAGVTLDPNNPDDAAKLAAALEPSTQIKFLRIKNSWGANRPDRAFAKDFPGYHDLWMDYLNGPIKFCPSEDNPTNENCTGESVPLANVMLPPGY